MKRLLLTGGCAVALLVPAGAVAAPTVLDRGQAADGTTFTLEAAKRLRSGRVNFRLLTDPPAGTPYAVTDLLSSARLRRAGGDQDVRAGSSLVCSEPSVSAVYGTVIRRVRRIVARFEDGRTMRLKRVRAPKRLRFNGWLFGAVRTAPQAVTEVRTYDRRGRRVAVARFSPEGCD